MKWQTSIGTWLAICSTLAGCAIDEEELGETESAEIVIGPTLPPLQRTVKSIVDEQVGPLWEAFTGKRRYAGLSVVVIRNGTRYQFHYGEAVLGSGVTPNASTYYAIGSVTKTFTASLLALYDRRGVVDLDDLLDDHTGYALGGDRDQITLEDLALHHSGLPRNPPGGEDAYQTGTYNGDFAALMGALDDCTSTPCEAPAALTDEGSYSNYGYAVLAHVLARKNSSSTTVQTALNTGLLDPLGMTSTRGKAHLTESSCVSSSDPCTYGDYGECTYLASCNNTFSPRAAIGYYQSGTWMFRAGDEGSDDNIKAGSGTLWSTPTDMGKWLAYHMDVNSSATTELRAILPTIHRVRTGDDLALFGKEVVTPEGHTLIRKTGLITNQFKTYMAFVDGGTTGVVVMSNLDGDFSTSGLGERLIDALVD
jgi:CubicO group peptidase (beta-lactamase class C family)